MSPRVLPLARHHNRLRLLPRPASVPPDIMLSPSKAGGVEHDIDFRATVQTTAVVETGSSEKRRSSNRDGARRRRRGSRSRSSRAAHTSMSASDGSFGSPSNERKEPMTEIVEYLVKFKDLSYLHAEWDQSIDCSVTPMPVAS